MTSSTSSSAHFRQDESFDEFDNDLVNDLVNDFETELENEITKEIQSRKFYSRRNQKSNVMFQNGDPFESEKRRKVVGKQKK